MTNDIVTDMLVTPREFMDAWLKSESHRLDLEETIDGLNRPSKELRMAHQIAIAESNFIAFQYWLKFDRHISDVFYNKLETNIQNSKLVDFINSK